jgi:two-component system CitB family sensor kinase
MAVRFRKISTQIFLAQLGILTAAMLVGFVLFAEEARNNLDHEYQARAESIAQTFAQVPAIRACLEDDIAQEDCPGTVQNLATDTMRSTGASYVVVIGMDQVRYSHPDPALIGKKVSEPIVTVDGKDHLGVDHGATGVTANARVPLYGTDGVMVGEVSVGLQESSVSSDLLAQLPAYGEWLVVALGLGAFAAWMLARRMKRRTFGLELDEIAQLLQEREAILHGIREGVIAIDPDGRISVINDEARRLLRLPAARRGAALADVLPPGRLREVLMDAGGAEDEIVVTDDHRLVVNRMPVVLSGRPHGAVVTLRDRTEVEALASELTGSRSLTESLRAQQHEFANRIHAISGLLELGRLPEALSYVHEIRGTSADLDETLRAHIAAPQIIGLLLGKAAEAGERGIRFVILPETALSEAPDRVQALTTIVGNLVDNAFDAVAGTPVPRRVEVSIVETDAELTVRVADSGPGIAPGALAHIFDDGYTTKGDSFAGHSGLGLALVHAAAAQVGGTVAVSSGPGAVFTVLLPRVDARLTEGARR